MNEIAKNIKKIAGDSNGHLIAAKVNEINGRSCNVSPISGAADIKNVRLNADMEGDSGIVITPAENSVVLLAAHTNTDMIVVMCSEISNIEFVIGNISFVADENGIVFNGNEKNSYLVDVNQLVTKINAIENDLNSIKNAFSNWLPVANDGGAALKSLISTWAENSLTNTTINDLKDEKIKH